MADEVTKQPAPEPQAAESPAGASPAAGASAPQGGGRSGDQRGGGGGGGEGRGRGRRGPRRDRDSEGSGDEIVVKVYRCATVVKGGRRFSFSALVVVGDRQGQVGIGYGKANEVPNAVEKATKAARRDMLRVRIEGTTIPHQVIGRFGASKVALIPAGEGTGVIAGSSVRAVLELAGVKDVLTKSYGSTSPKNLVKAAYDGLSQLRTREQVAGLRQVTLVS